jgi:type IV pilus assembly protein PilY1
MRTWQVGIIALCTSAMTLAQNSVPNTVELSPLPLDRTLAVPSLAVLGLNSSVLGSGTLAFKGGYDPADWSGVLHAVTLNGDGTSNGVVWDAGALLTRRSPASRTILSASKSAAGVISGIAFEPSAPFDTGQKQALMWPEPAHPNDTPEARIDYLRGGRSGELDGILRVRSGLLGAIVHAQTVYIGYPSGNYFDAWPKGAPEAAPGAQSYASFVTRHAGREPFLYIAANDGMLHAFRSPVPACKRQDDNQRCVVYDSGSNAGEEAWAYVPRAAYRNLGNLTRVRGFQFQPTVDATPVTRDVFFGELGAAQWHTLLVGGLRLGGRGVYALDVTDPTSASETAPERTVLWEFDADAPAGTSDVGSAYQPADLGYTYGQPAIARLANGRWAVLVPNGYFADCSKPEKPLRCEDAGGTPPSYAALFVLDAQTGAVIAELKTPTIEGVHAYGLFTPVLGDYDNDQIDDVAFAGDLAGNLWRFDLSSSTPSEWKVTLAYQPAEQGTQPITVMPRLMPDPSTNRFIVVFGTGKYLANSDKDDTTLQSIYGIRDKGGTVTRGSLVTQTLNEVTVSDAAAGNATLRTLTSHAVPMKAGGWRIDLDVATGERVINTPTALFDTNTVLVDTLIPNGDQPGGAVMAIDAATGTARTIVAFGGASYAGARIESPSTTTGTLPMATQIGGGKQMLPGLMLKGGKAGFDLPLSLHSPLWRRRSWSILTPDY